MEVFTVEACRLRERMISSDLLFLIAKYLDSGVSKRAAEVLFEEIRNKKMVPQRYDWLGNRHEQTLDAWEKLHPHISGSTLLNLCGNIIPLLDQVAPSGIVQANTLLGAGSCSILRVQASSVLKRLELSRVVARIQRRTFLDPPNLPSIPSQPMVIAGREMQGSCSLHHLAKEQVFKRMQLLKRSLGHLSAVYCCLFDRSGFYVITGADDRLIKVWSLITGRLLATLRGASAEISDLAISPDNKHIAAGSCDKIVRVWDLLTTTPVAVLSGHSGHITAIDFCPGPGIHQQFLVSTSNDGCLAFWYYDRESSSGNISFNEKPVKINERVRPGQAQLVGLSFSPGGSFLAIGGADHHVRVYLTTAPDGPQRILEIDAHSDRVDSIQWCHSGCRFVSGSKDGTIIIWRFERQEWLHLRLTMEHLQDFHGPQNEINQQPQQQRPLRVTMVRWTCDDKEIIATVSDTSFRIWDSVTGVMLHALAGHTDEVYVIECHPVIAQLVLTAGHDGKLVLWDVLSGVMVASFFNAIEGEGHGCLFDARWSPCGMFIVATDSHGHLSYFGFAQDNRYDKIPYEQFFHTDYRPLMRDARHQVLDEETQQAPHLMPVPFLVNMDGVPHPASLQRLVPGRENATDAELQPNVPPVDNNSGMEDSTEDMRMNNQIPTIDDMINRLALEQRNHHTANVVEVAEGGSSVSTEEDPLADQAVEEQALPILYHGPFVPRLSSRRLLELQTYTELEADKETTYYDTQMRLTPWRSRTMQSVPLTAAQRRRQRQRQIVDQSIQHRPVRTSSGRIIASIPRFGQQYHTSDEHSSGEMTGDNLSDDEIGSEGPASRRNQFESSDFSDEPRAAASSSTHHTRRLTVRQRALQRRTRTIEDRPTSPSARTSRDPVSRSSGLRSRSENGLRRACRRSAVRDASIDETDVQSPPPSVSSVASSSKLPRNMGAGESSTMADESETNSTSPWLTEVQPRKSPYFPQKNDELVYFKQGHQLYVETVRRRCIYEVKPNELPWCRSFIKDVEIVRVVGIKYELRPPALCCLKLAKLNPQTGGITGGSFSIRYHDTPDVVDFLVLRTTYDAAMRRKWSPGDNFRASIEDVWWTGVIQEHRPLDTSKPDSPFLSYQVTWSQGGCEALSPWDIEPHNTLIADEDAVNNIDANEQPSAGRAVWSLRAEDWSQEDPESEKRRIRLCLEQVMQLAIAEPFLTPVDLNMYPTYAQVIAYPIDLSTIKARLENGFYRSLASLQYDIGYLSINTEKFNQPHSVIVRSSRIVRDVCLTVISDVNYTDVTPVYHNVFKQYTEDQPQQDVVNGDPRSPRVARRIGKRRFTDKTWQEHCSEVLSSLMQHADSENFRRPVDPDRNPDYYHVVEHPMDLTTIGRDLESNVYSGPQDFVENVRLMFSNSKLFNTNKRSSIYTMTLRLSGYFEERIKLISSFFAGRQRRTRFRRPSLSENGEVNLHSSPRVVLNRMSTRRHLESHISMPSTSSGRRCESAHQNALSPDLAEDEGSATSESSRSSSPESHEGEVSPPRLRSRRTHANYAEWGDETPTAGVPGSSSVNQPQRNHNGRRNSRHSVSTDPVPRVAFLRSNSRYGDSQSRHREDRLSTSSALQSHVRLRRRPGRQRPVISDDESHDNPVVENHRRSTSVKRDQMRATRLSRQSMASEEEEEEEESLPTRSHRHKPLEQPRRPARSAATRASVRMLEGADLSCSEDEPPPPKRRRCFVQEVESRSTRSHRAPSSHSQESGDSDQSHTIVRRISISSRGRLRKLDPRAFAVE